VFAFVFASFSFFHFCRRSCFHIARPAIDFIITKTKTNGKKKNSVKTNVFTDFPLSGFAFYALCRLQKQKLP